MHQIRGVAVLVVGLIMLVLGAPGVDGLDADSLTSPQQRERLRGTWVGSLEVTIADLNRWFRLPVVARLSPLQRPLRIAQSWALYGVGPNQSRRMEIRVDGRLVFRSGDADATWLAPALRYRRVRPMVVNTCMDDSERTPLLLNAIRNRAVRDFGAEEVTVRCTASPWPGDVEREVLSYAASAPDWTWSR